MLVRGKLLNCVLELWRVEIKQHIKQEKSEINGGV